MGGLVHIVPVHAMVMMLYSSSIAPQVTMTAGRGYIIVPGFQFTFMLLLVLSS
jgi:hypothetical protein